MIKKVIQGILASLLISSAVAKEIDLNACLGCHGKEYNKMALGKSKVVAEMSQIDIEKSLIGYKEGTYGGSMKGLMKGQVMKYTDSQLHKMSMSIARDCNTTVCIVK